MLGFRDLVGIPNVVAVMDGTHCAIRKRKDEQQYYQRYKRARTLNNQVVIDSERRFVDVECGYPGAMHDGRIWNRSDLRQRLLTNEILQGEGVQF